MSEREFLLCRGVEGVRGVPVRGGGKGEGRGECQTRFRMRHSVSIKDRTSAPAKPMSSKAVSAYRRGGVSFGAGFSSRFSEGGVPVPFFMRLRMSGRISLRSAPFALPPSACRPPVMLITRGRIFIIAFPRGAASPSFSLFIPPSADMRAIRVLISVIFTSRNPIYADIL